MLYFKWKKALTVDFSETVYVEGTIGIYGELNGQIKTICC